MLRAVGFFNAEDIEGILADTSTHCPLRCGQNAAEEKMKETKERNEKKGMSVSYFDIWSKGQQ